MKKFILFLTFVIVLSVCATGCKKDSGKNNSTSKNSLTYSSSVTSESFSDSSSNSAIIYDIQVIQAVGGNVSTDKIKAQEGEVVTVIVESDNNYVLSESGIQVNGVKIKGNTFIMPACNVVITVNFTKTENFGESDLRIVIGEAISEWYARYDEAGVNLTIKVKDEYLKVGNKDIGYDDNVEFDIGLKSSSIGRDIDYTYNLLATAGGKYFFRKAITSDSYGAENDTSLNIAPGSNFWISFKNVLYSDGKTGWVVEIYLGYDLLNTTAEQAIGNLTIAPSMRNSEESQSTWSSESSLGNVWGNAKDFLLITVDGNFINRA